MNTQDRTARTEGRGGRSAASRVLGMAVLLAAGLWLGWKVWVVNLDQSCWLDQWPQLERCKAVVGTTPEEQIERLRERLARNPGDAQSMVALATYTQLPGGIPGMDNAAVLSTAEQMAPQDGYVLRLRAQQLLKDRQWPEALDRLTRLSQFHRDAEATRVIAEMIGQSGNDPALMAALETALKSDGRWLDGVLRAMPGVKMPVATAMPLLNQALPAGLVSPALSQFLMRQLKSEGRWLEAHALWLNLWKKPLGFLFNGDFEQAFVSGGFDWEINDNDTYRAGARVSLAGRGERGQVLRVDFTGKAIRPPVLRQQMLLPPGRYRFSGEYQSADLRSNEGLTWVFSCATGGRELARTPPLKTTGRAWQTLGVDVDVPADCGLGVALALQTQAPYEAKTGLRGEVVFDRFTLVLAPATTAAIPGATPQ